MMLEDDSPHDGVCSYCRRTHISFRAASSKFIPTLHTSATNEIFGTGVFQFSYAAPAAWNSLPAELRDNPSSVLFNLYLLILVYL